MPNRTIAPALNEIKDIHFVAPNTIPLSSEVNLYHMKNVPNETSRFDLYFDAGKCRGTHGIPSFVNGLLLSGTAEKTSIEINNEINALGGFLETGISVENAVLSIYALRENLLPIFKIIMDAISNVSFDKNEVEELLSDRKQRLEISKEKVGFLAQRAFQEELFASNSIYATPVSEDDFDNVTISDLKDFHNAHYLNGLRKMVIVGDLEQKEIEAFKTIATPFISDQLEPFASDLKNTVGATHIEKEGALQSAIRVGRILFNKDHDDYLDFLVLNTILGDYFGSRLMANIREDKGYTYGIGTLLAELNETGYFLIATEVGKDVREDTLKEIQFELNRLQTELVPQDELELVKNYMLGQLLKSADGPYAMTDLFLSAELHGKDLEFYNSALHRIQTITSERIMELAKRYLNWEDMTIVSAG